MAKITIGDVIVTADHGALSFTRRDQSTPLVRLNAVEAGKLLDFLRSYVTTELNQRSAFRVPVWPASGLSATLRSDQTVHAVRPLDISLTGMSFEFSSADAPELPSDADVEITLAFEGDTLTLPGVVQRREAKRYGIFFPGSIRNEELDPPWSLVSIVMELQRRLAAPRG